MPTTRSTPASEAWRALLIAFTGIHGELARELEDELGVHIEHYEILLMLFEAGAEGIRPSQIADRRRLSRSGATRLIDRLESKGIVERRSYDDDRRGSVVVLGPEGHKLFTVAGRLHLAGIERHVGEKLTVAEMAELRRLLEKLSLEG